MFFKQHRQEYYRHLQAVRLDGAWEEWLEFYLTGVEEVSQSASESAKKILSLFEKDRKRVEELGKAALSAYRCFELLKKRVVISMSVACKELKTTFPTANAALKNLEKLGIVREMSGRKRHRLFAYYPYLKVLQQGTDAPAE